MMIPESPWIQPVAPPREKRRRSRDPPDGQKRPNGRPKSRTEEEPTSTITFQLQGPPEQWNFDDFADAEALIPFSQVRDRATPRAVLRAVKFRGELVFHVLLADSRVVQMKRSEILEVGVNLYLDFLEDRLRQRY
jgi:hypothetical protein